MSEKCSASSPGGPKWFPSVFGGFNMMSANPNGGPKLCLQACRRGKDSVRQPNGGAKNNFARLGGHLAGCHFGFGG